MRRPRATRTCGWPGARHSTLATMTPSIQRIGDTVNTLGECPLWCPTEQVLYWTDIEQRRLHRYDPEAGASVTRDLPGRPGSFGITSEPGRLAVALETDLVLYDWETEQIRAVAQIEEPALGNRLNDGRTDHAGRFIVGTMWPQPDDEKFSGGLYRIDSDGTVEQLEADVGIPNGLVFDRERSRMYWADTFHSTIWVWDYDLDSGERHNRRVFFDYRESDVAQGLPDGAALDAQGCYWSASVHGWALTRITPDGDVDRVIDLPLAMPTMPAFGGADLSTIFVTSIDGGMVDEKRSKGVPSGALLAVDAGVQGLPEPLFGPS